MTPEPAGAGIGQRLTLSVISHGHGPMLHRLLGDLSSLPSMAGARVIVTLNLAGEAFDPADWPALSLVVRRNAQPKGFGANHNAAFEQCATPWFAVLNPDLRLPRDPFPALLAEGARHPRIGVVAPRIVDSAGHSEDSVRLNPTPWSVARRTFDRRVGRANPADGGFFWLAGMFLLFSSPAYRAARGFDEQFFLYYEDYDICARLQRLGFAVAFSPDTSAVHDAQRDSHRKLRHLRWHVSSLLRVWTSSPFWWAQMGARARGGGTMGAP